MILSDTTIEKHLDSGKIDIDPDPTAMQIQPASLDVRLGTKLYCPESDSFIEDTSFTLKPFTRYLGQTREHVSLPNDIAAQLAGRSTVGRMGIIVHKTAGWIDPQFSGTITLELMNMGMEPVTLEAGDRIAQLVFLWCDSPSMGYNGQYDGQQRPTPAKEI